MRSRIRIFSLSLINNQNLVSLKNPPTIEFNTSISVSLRVRVPSFQFILINIQKNQRRLFSAINFVSSPKGGKRNNQNRIIDIEEKTWKVLKIEKQTFSALVWLCSCFTHSSYPLWRQQVHETKQKIWATKGKLNFPCMLF